MTQQLTQGYYHVLNGENGLGKTHFLAKLSEQTLENLVNDSIDANSLCPFYIENMICLSGIAFDKFPRYVDFKKEFNEDTKRLLRYCYCGYTTNNNISTEIIPFRTVLDITAYKYRDLNKEELEELRKRVKFFLQKLEKIGFDPKITIKIGESSTKKMSAEDYDIGPYTQIDKDLDAQIKKLINAINNKARNDLKDIIFRKDNDEYCLRKKEKFRNLSSGQYQIIRCIFSLVLTITPDSLVIYDEPEISLHPEWQSEIIQILMEIVEAEGLGEDSTSNKHATVVIATHSPLITSSFSTSKIKISNYDSNNNSFKWDDQQYYGWDANNLLKEHFNLKSARNQEFINKINDLLKSFQDREDDKLKEEYEKLELLLWNKNTDDFSLSVNDRLYGTLRAIKAYVETIE
jgi:hypothetical protein